MNIADLLAHLDVASIRPPTASKVRNHLHFVEYVCDGSSPYPPAAADLVLGDAAAVALAPKLGCQLPYLIVAMRISNEAPRPRRGGAQDRRPASRPGAHLYHQCRGHRPALRKHEDAVAHSAGEHKTAVLDCHQFPHGLLRNRVIVVANGHCRIEAIAIRE